MDKGPLVAGTGSVVGVAVAGVDVVPPCEVVEVGWVSPALGGFDDEQAARRMPAPISGRAAWHNLRADDAPGRGDGAALISTA
jgi:hypothetical protein